MTGENEKCDEVFTEYGYMAFDIALTGLVEGESVAYSISVVPDLDITNLELYYIDETDELIPVEYKVTTDELNNVYVEFTTTYVGTFVYGSPNVPEGYVLTSLALANIPRDVFLGTSLTLDETAEITATYTMEGAEDFVRKLTIYDYDYTNFSDFDVNVSGKQTVTFTFEGLEATFDIYVWGETFTDETSSVTVKVGEDEYGVISATVTQSTNDNVATVITDVIKGDNYVAYDISLNYSEGYEANEAEKTVTLPIPEGVTNPVVFYVSEDGEIEDMNAEKGDGVVTFTTTHFSDYVIGESTEIVVPDSETATGSGESTTTKKTVYVQTSSVSRGNSYLIVNGNSAGNYYALKNNNGTVDATNVNIKSDSKIGTYIELDDATNELWTISASSPSAIKNGDYYLALNSSNKLLLNNTAYNWTYSETQIYVSKWNYGRQYTYYLAFNDGWESNTTSANVYFYIPTEVDLETTVSGTYSIAGESDKVTKVVTNGATVELGSVLTFKPTAGSAITTENPSGVTYTVVEGGDPNSVISGISGNTVTFSGKYGKALVKISYTTTFGVVTNYIVIEASAPTYVLDITSGETVVTGTTVSKKEVTASTTLQLGTQIQFVDEDGAEIVELPEGATIEWHIPEEYQNIATVGHNTGLITFKGIDGAFYVTATLSVNGKNYTAGVNISATTTSYSTPTDGAEDFPEYPNEGAIRYDKTATAVGNFSETGITQIELSMTGVPYTTGSEMDVVIMLDQSTSMDDNRIAATVAATKAFIKSIVINEDGTYNDNRIYVGYFNGAKTYDISDSANIGGDLATIDNKTELDALFASIDDEFDGSPSTSGTQYAVALQKCYNRLNTAKTDGVGNNRQQFCVFMSDGVPTTYQYSETEMHGSTSSTSEGYSDMKGMFTGTNYDTRSSSYKYEYYSTQMKANGVTVYTVGLGLEAKNNAWSGASATQCLNAASLLLNDIAGPAKETELGTGSNLNKKDKYFYSVEDADAATNMTSVFETIAMKILQAATDVTVEDKITEQLILHGEGGISAIALSSDGETLTVETI